MGLLNGYVGIREKKMETTVASRGYIGVTQRFTRPGLKLVGQTLLFQRCQSTKVSNTLNPYTFPI